MNLEFSSIQEYSHTCNDFIRTRRALVPLSVLTQPQNTEHDRLCAQNRRDIECSSQDQH